MILMSSWLMFICLVKIIRVAMRSIITDGIFRVRYRDGFDKLRLVEAGEIFKITISLPLIYSRKDIIFGWIFHPSTFRNLMSTPIPARMKA